ncbi:hypothetical protein SAMN04488040_2265 [Sulfitobacter marinus]|uniref:Uncharacterized protein n=1 Tax=Sulfitobacter marinus TaxID=394264 RepID=A0A1I6THJ6_9RHOB|nr:hypothetical protein [Sulfitobacter marinus]SFS88631.1 hypothetical protein SAMN04488040_2265 [Sulfitobacter marinus]
MVIFQEKHNALRLIFSALFCLMLVLSGGVLMTDHDRSSLSLAAIPFAEAVIETALPDPVQTRHPLAVSRPAAVLHQMHAETETDVVGLISTVAQSFDDTRSGQALESYLVWAVTAGKSDKYIDALLNSAASKGHFEVPKPLVTLSGRLDTPSLLRSVLVAARHEEAGEKFNQIAEAQVGQIIEIPGL